MPIVLDICICVDILGGLIMHKRARNHKLLVEFERKHVYSKIKSYYFEQVVSQCDWWDFWYKNTLEYEPQGERETRKYLKGIVQFIPSTL